MRYFLKAAPEASVTLGVADVSLSNVTAGPAETVHL
jgi:hypothetical protein